MTRKGPYDLTSHSIPDSNGLILGPGCNLASSLDPLLSKQSALFGNTTPTSDRFGVSVPSTRPPAVRGAIFNGEAVIFPPIFHSAALLAEGAEAEEYTRCFL